MAREVGDGRFVLRDWRGRTVAHEDRGDGPRTVVLVHGLLLPASVNAPLADALVAAGYRVLQPELLGHGSSDAPDDPAAYRMDEAAAQVLDLLDELGIEQAIVGGMSLGANLSLHLAVAAPERIAGIVCEMPVLEGGHLGATACLAPLWALLRFGAVPVGVVFAAARRLPRTGHTIVDAAIGCAGLPRSMAAVMHGYAVGPTAPSRTLRRSLTTPTLVVAHGRDWIHPIDDAEQLVDEVPGARLVRARHAFELRTRPARLCAEVVAFVDEVFADVEEPAA